MLDPETSPIHQLVSPWWVAKQRPRSWEVPALRVILTEAALSELRINITYGITYCPFSDSRVQWGAAYLNNLENSWFSIHEDTTARAAWNFDPPCVLCGKDLAAGSS